MLKDIGAPELIIILVIVLVVFGAGRLPEVGSALGKGIHNFKRASSGEDEKDEKRTPQPEPQSVVPSDKTSHLTH